MFWKKKYKKIDKILYKGYEIPIYSNGEITYAGHPQKEDVNVEENRVYKIDDISELKTGILKIIKFGEDVDQSEFFPKSVGTVLISKKIPKEKTIKITESQFTELVKNHVIK